jgi:hypothetical protein
MSLARVSQVVLLLALWSSVALAQRPGPEFWRKVTCEPFEPRTKLEALEDRQGTIVIRGFTRIITLEIRGLRIDAVEMKEIGSTDRAKGAVVVLQREREGRIEDNRAFVDYEELEPLLNALDTLSRVDETVTKLAGFEAHYRTRGDFEIRVFRQTRSGTAVTLQTGICDYTTETLTLDELAKLKAMFQEVKTRLDELK